MLDFWKIRERLRQLFKRRMESHARTLQRSHDVACREKPLSLADRLVQLMVVWVEGQHADAEGASGSLNAIYEQCNGAELIELDTQMRQLMDWMHGSALSNISPSRLSRLVSERDSCVPALGAFSCHLNGYVREEAVRLLADDGDGNSIPFLLLRNNDWVQPVRRRARDAIFKYLSTDRFVFSERNLYLSFRLSLQSRGSHDTLVHSVAAKFFSTGNSKAFQKLLGSEDRLLRRKVVEFGLRSDATVAEEIAIEAMRSVDPIIRLWAVRWAGEHLDQPPLRRALAQHTADSFLPVRRVILRATLFHFPAEANRFLKAALLDPGLSLREEARFHLRKLGVDSFATVYRNAIDEARQLDIAILGLGETGSGTDAETAATFLEHPIAKVRRAAVRAVAKLDAHSHCDALLNRLADKSPKVTREAVAALAPHVLDLEFVSVWERFKDEPRPHVRLAVLQLASHLSPWRQLPCLLEGIATGDERIRHWGISQIERQYNRVFTSPTPDEREKIERVIETNHDRLPSGFVYEFRSWLDVRTR